MFLKNNMRPAFAAASADGQAVNRKRKNDAFMYDASASETDDFGAFGSAGASNGAPKQKPKRSGSSLNMTSILIAVAAVVVVILLIVLVVALVGGSGKNIKFEDNSFVAFCDEDQVWRVAANGKIVGEYENEIELRIADDRSFAYIIEHSEDGYTVSYTTGKEAVEMVASPVAKILDTASLVPGVVYLDMDNSSIYMYNEKSGEERISRDVEATLANTDEHSFMISGDAQTVIYTQRDADRPADVSHLCVYKDNSSEKFQKNMKPEAISDDGSLIYASATKDNVSRSLYVLPYTGEYDRYLLSENFNSIIELNTDGDEVVFTTLGGDSDALISTYVVAFNIKKMDEVASPVRIARGAPYAPISVDGKTARFSTFADTYFEAQLLDVEIFENQVPVYYVSKKYEVRRIAKFGGKFDSKGDYFYYTNQDNTLQRIDLSESDPVAEKIAEDIVDFEITQKGNIYWLDDTTRLMFYNTSKDKRQRIAEDVESIEMHTYSNTLYYTTSTALSVQYTEEGSKAEPAKFDGAAVTGAPEFINPEYKRTFAAFYDADNDEWRLFYTSNGSKFKLIGVCSEVSGFYEPIDLEDILGGITSDDSDSDTSDTE